MLIKSYIFKYVLKCENRMKKRIAFLALTVFVINTSSANNMKIDDNCEMEHKYLKLLYKRNLKFQSLDNDKFDAIHAMRTDKVSVLFNYKMYCDQTWQKWHGCYKHYIKHDLGIISGYEKLKGYVALSDWHTVKKGSLVDVTTCIGHNLDLEFGNH